ncbi:MAG: phospholipase D-like domain-containing protein [Prevotellaceae bacterium]|jgi:superfamily II DNA or RNA helicase/HKD family nuclease|nr:phospholipase D-like domain-containing protein [Prevotellaceae bacterium]
MTTDTRFFTNEAGLTLLDRFKATLKDSKYFDILVGYFRLSGFYQLYDSFETIEKSRILVGLSIDKETYNAIQHNRENAIIDFESDKNTKLQYEKNVISEIESVSENNEQVQFGINKFIELLNSKRLEIRVFPSRDIHAKVYINRYNENINHVQYGSVITGSSNFSESGLIAQREFNVELKDRPDVDFALKQFEDLWKEGVDVSADFVDFIIDKTWLNDKITPYELYLKCVYEYLEEDINLEDGFEPFLPKGFMELRYQTQAATNAKKILETYNGVFLSDVVGLGKTFIAALLLQQLQGRILVVCPPVLQEYWEDSLRDFGVRNFEVQSLGKLEHILRKDTSKYKYVVVDEAHRFRNENTRSYADLLDICRGKKVILVTATPLNNSIEDIFTQLKLFQIPKMSTIPGIPDLEKFFNKLKKTLKEAKPKLPAVEQDKDEYTKAIKAVSEEIRDKILRFVMIRRTRSDVKNYFKDDLSKQDIVFPEIADPGRMVYQFDNELECVFKQTVELLRRFNYTRYVPLLYYTGELTEFQRQQQRNLGGFMKSLLVKRLESSFYAFKKSIGRFIDLHERFLDMFDKGTVYVSKKVNVFDLLDADDIETLEQLVEDDKAEKYETSDFKGEYKNLLEQDILILKEIREIWQPVNTDPKIETLIHHLQTDKKIAGRKVVLFTESKETGDYLFENLFSKFQKKVMFYSSHGGRYEDLKTKHNHALSRNTVTNNFDPKAENPSDDVLILITTDILAEGINLHRSNVLINYDLPWNPTRVLQRAGRVNRLGSKHGNIHILNFFPTTQADMHLGLEANITNKLQMFHYIMGEDAKYLSDGEIIGSQELFNTLNNKATYTGEEDEENSELKYLTMMREIRDTNPVLFNKIKKLPKQARSGMKSKNGENRMITFFRLGNLKKFYLYEELQSQEINFFDAMNLIECKPDTERLPVPANYFNMLHVNKLKFRQDTTENSEMPDKKGGKSNADFIDKLLKSSDFKNYKKFTESDEEFIATVRLMLTGGIIAKKTAQLIRKELEKIALAENRLDPMKILYTLRERIKPMDMERISGRSVSYLKKEVILSEYFLE